LTITNSTVSHNQTIGFGGGLENNQEAIIRFSTFSENSGSSGGNIRSAISPLSLTNSIIANASAGAVCYSFSNNIISLGYNIDSDGTCNLTQPNDQPNSDPLLGPLGNNGGQTPTHALLFGNPAIDAGDNSSCPITDQRGEIRPVDGDDDNIAVCDIGAYESGATQISYVYLPAILEND
jgi:hypothetical protein